ncbi:MAG: 3-phosphoserine/phosphohydroxythreonine transaminase [Spirochaetales bacterium]|nr:3-phosphoserine/phosphohydroxythreonine transaminase [Spirochaetales bacterium]
MKRAHNFYAGPSTLPLSVLKELQGEMVEYHNLGLSLLETSHRSPEYDEVHHGAMHLVKELLSLPDNYKVLFLQGGATMQFSMVPMNFLAEGSHADYLNSGAWAKKAIADARLYGSVEVTFDGKEKGYMSLPEPRSVVSTPGAQYVHITSNETIGGVQWKDFPATEAPLVADMSSDILSRPIPIERFGLIYAGAQKNLGPSGVTLVIVREDLLTKEQGKVGAYLKYSTHAESDSLYNTPPVFGIYALGKVLSWVKAQGGLPAVTANNRTKADLVYRAIESTDGFYHCPVDPSFRSDMNIVFTLRKGDLDKSFLDGSEERGMLGLKGHRSVGGFRASLYNAMPIEGAKALADYMVEFAQKNG